MELLIQAISPKRDKLLVELVAEMKLSEAFPNGSSSNTKRAEAFAAVRLAAKKLEEVHPSKENYEILEENLIACEQSDDQTRLRYLRRLGSSVSSLYPSTDLKKASDMPLDEAITIVELHDSLRTVFRDLGRVLGYPVFARDTPILRPGKAKIEVATVQVNNNVL